MHGRRSTVNLSRGTQALASSSWRQMIRNIRRILLIGDVRPGTVACALRTGAAQLGIEADILDVSAAGAAPGLVRSFNWHFRGRRPTWLGTFSKQAVEVSKSRRPQAIVTTGIAAVNDKALCAIRSIGVLCLNYSTDDPWNRLHFAPWFIKAIPNYDIVFSPREANRQQFTDAGVRRVVHLPFAYDPYVHFPQRASTRKEALEVESDVLFIGTGDEDRVNFIDALQHAGLHVGLYGSFWNRYRETRGMSRGQADLRTMRMATAEAKVCLCLVRRANRDCHVMRSYEIGAMRGCPLAEDTDDHRALFGHEGAGALYFATIPEMLEKAKWLITHPREREHMADVAHKRVTSGRNTYADRLATMLAESTKICDT